MQLIACRVLCDLRQVRLRISVYDVEQPWAAFRASKHDIDRHPDRGTRDRSDRVCLARVSAEKDRKPYDAFIADRADFDGPAILHAMNDRDRRIFGKVEMRPPFTGSGENVTNLQRHSFQVRLQRGSRVGRERIEQAILRDLTVRFGIALGIAIASSGDGVREHKMGASVALPFVDETSN
jgi:hypothetical protein